MYQWIHTVFLILMTIIPARRWSVQFLSLGHLLSKTCMFLLALWFSSAYTHTHIEKHWSYYKLSFVESVIGCLSMPHPPPTPLNWQRKRNSKQSCIKVGFNCKQMILRRKNTLWWMKVQRQNHSEEKLKGTKPKWLQVGDIAKIIQCQNLTDKVAVKISALILLSKIHF